MRMPSINVYVSEALQKEMQTIDPALSWSRIAAEAFEHKIQLERTKAVNVTEANIARLQASREQAAEKRHAEGVRIGKTWALETAEYDELERVAQVDGEVLDQWFGQPDAHLGAAKLLAQMILDDQTPSRDEVAVQMDRIFSRKAPTLAEIRGFFEGAGEIFDQV
jgi:hypothetical protein